MVTDLERAGALKQALVDFVYDAEGELAIALETYAAAQMRSPVRDLDQQAFTIETFLTEGQVEGKTPLTWFIESEDLSSADQQLIQSWQHSFTGLFAVTEVLADGLRTINWLTAKPYTIRFISESQKRDMTRLNQRDIILSRIAPISDTEWMFSGPYVLKGRLGKPKLAVAIGQFKDDHWNSIYGDAPELLEEAWRSVERYHQDFLDFFGSDEVTLSGHELSKKLSEFQEVLSQRHLEMAGIDPSKSLAEMAEEAGVEPEDIDAIAETLGVNPETLSKMIQNKHAAKLTAPQVELPPDLKRADQVTILADSRWGQVFLNDYQTFKELLAANPAPETEAGQRLDKLARHYLEDAKGKAFIWHRLAQTSPQALEAVLQRVLERPQFELQQLDDVLQEFDKPLEPHLPETASVPLHLNDLFQEALAEVSKTKKKKKKASTKGFQ